MKTTTRWSGLAAALMLSTVANGQVHISEIHYDNAGTDTGEAIEISSPAGADLTGWQIVLYNGSNGATYDSDLLTGLAPAVCGERQVVVLNYPVNGIQNGSPDAIALIDPGATVVEFLSYEGTLVATNGPALGLQSIDVGVGEAGTETPGLSLSRQATGAWAGPAPQSFGACNDGGEPAAEVASVTLAPSNSTVYVGASITLNATAFDSTGAPVVGVLFDWTSSDPAVAGVSASGVVSAASTGTVLIAATAPNGVSGTAAVQVEAAPPSTGEFRINELHYDNAGVDVNEAIEIEGPAGADLTGLTVEFYNGNGGASYRSHTFTGVLPASCGTRGVIAEVFPTDAIQNGAPDGVALIAANGQVIEFLSYEGTFTAGSGAAAGRVSVDIGVSQTNATSGTSLQRDSNDTWFSGVSNFGACNPDSPVPPGNTLQFTGRVPSDVPLPVGFEDQLFARLVAPGNVTVPSTFSWEALTPDVAIIDANGVIRALAPGDATFRATAAADGTTATWTLPMRVAVASDSAQYGNNTEFGEPLDTDPTDDYIIERPQFTSSWNPDRGAPNWVAYAIDATHFGAEDRCDCFTMDAELPASLPRLTTADYTGAGDFHGYGIDRGHLARSFDRTAGGLDNATTYYFSNIIPQAADNNQGPWAQFENHLGDLARLQDREVYVIAGASGDQGTIKNEGKIVIPAHTWKVALIMGRDQGLDGVRDYRDVEVLAVILPNEPGIRNVPWQDYLRTVDEVESLSGYDLLALLEDDVEAAVESGTQPPIAAISGPAGSIGEGAGFSLSAVGSVDPNGSIASYTWDLGDGNIAEGVSVTHAYAQEGTYAVRLTVIDNDGLEDVATFTVTVHDSSPGLAAALPLIDQLVAAGKVSREVGVLLKAQVMAAQVLMGRGNDAGARVIIRALLAQIDLLVRWRVVTAADVASLRAVLVGAVIPA